MSAPRSLGAACFVLIAACQPGAGAPATRPGPPVRMFTIANLVGGWRWMLRTSEAGTTRVEDEAWRFRPGRTPTELLGRYVRTVEVHSDNRTPFACNQRPWYRQRAVFDVRVEITQTGFVIKETDYRAEPGPCDHGFRHVGEYSADLDGERLRLRWPGGTQTLLKVDATVAELAEDPWTATPSLYGPWRWDATSYDDDGNLRDETEWWEIIRRSETRLDATYRRRVTVRSPDGSKIACANAPSWSFDDAYVLDGQREEEHWHFYERAADPGDHPCLRVTPHRALDEATAEQLGDAVLLEWRGKRKQILYRADAGAP
jgi:hypothetical protein